ncbi:hypothetical protein HED42_08755 [Enterococcus casseliflavus]|uniref:hypothetical protein n=1 Tax=Enterococcus casseliflavus TaxID=37734 RepID=UPI001432E6E2|nr:hypothetical protein [Enterococcus casseliflavus]NKD38221.1 hypothetical protein [Enterococcus casseliflavus]
MKITDKLEAPVHDPVVERGDILKVVDEGTTSYYIVAKRAGEGTNVLINLTNGGNWSSMEIPLQSRLSFYEDDVFNDYIFGDDVVEVTHIPENKVELVIGG